MEPISGKEWRDASSMKCASCVTKESCASAGRSSKMLSRRTPETCGRRFGIEQKRYIRGLSYLFEEHVGPKRMRLIKLISQDFGHRNRRPFEDEFHRGDLLANKSLSERTSPFSRSRDSARPLIP